MFQRFWGPLKYVASGSAGTLFGMHVIGYPAYVEGESMKPTLNPEGRFKNDYVWCCRWKNWLYQYERGDVVTLISPKDPSQRLIKRIIAVQGDRIKTRSYKNKYVIIPEGHVWVEGDNLKRSVDSNSYGPVSAGLITGKATHIIWPPYRWGKVEHAVPVERVTKKKE